MAAMPQGAKGQGTDAAVLSGTVTDPTGAVIRGAVAHLKPSGIWRHGTEREQSSDGSGTFHFQVPAGSYVLDVQAPGFSLYKTPVLSLKPSGNVHLPVRLSVAGLQQEISVLEDATSGSASLENSASALVFEGERLSLLSNDNETLRQQLQALAGGLGTPDFVINGFSGGRLPPKSSIRSIRINDNPYSSYYSDYGGSRVEITTKAGADRLHGSVMFSGTDQPLDARNPYTFAKAPFYDFQQDGNLNGPIGRKTSFFLADTVERLANNSVVNAADPAAPATQISTTVPSPQSTQVYSLRLDRQFTEKNYGFIRNEWSQTHVANSGIAPLILPDAAFAMNTLTDSLQAADTQVLGPHAVNEARFQYLRTRVRQDPNSYLPSVIVQGSFQSGGVPSQQLRDGQDAYEMQDLLDVDHGRHAIRAGFRVRALRDANRSSAGFNGQYTFPDVASYLEGQATQYSQTVGQQSAVLTTAELGFYAEDDWKITPNLTFNYGFRFESQSAIPDGSDPAPRVGFAWAVLPGKSKTPVVTLRGGYGIFYSRFPAAQLLQSVRQNGTRQVAYVAQNTGFDPSGPPPGLVLSAAEPTTFMVNPRLRSPYLQVAGVSVERAVGHYGTVSANLLFEHNSHDFLTRNLNAPLPGTFLPGDPSGGVKPLGAGNVYAFSSDSNGNLERFYLNYRFQITSRLFAFGVFDADKSFDEADGIDQFPSNEYNLRQDYSRAALDRAQLFTGGFQWLLPYGVQITPFLYAHSGAPFNVTTGQDLNGDTIYNDRPGTATGITRPSVVPTAFGNFDVSPIPGQPVLPRNFGTAPGYFWLQLQASKDVHLGPRPAAQSAGPGGKPSAVPDRPWDLNFAIEVHNLTNHNNPGLPVGVLSAQPCGGNGTAGCACSSGQCPLVPSPYFGHSLSLAGDFSPITASNRTILLQTTFTW